MAKAMVARQEPRGQALPLEAIRIERHLNFYEGGRDRTPERIRSEDVALAPDLLGRFEYRMSEDERKAWPDPARIGKHLHGLSELVRTRCLDELSGEAQELLGAAVEYLGVLLEVAGESPEVRRKQYMVRLRDAARTVEVCGRS